MIVVQKNDSKVHWVYLADLKKCEYAGWAHPLNIYKWYSSIDDNVRAIQTACSSNYAGVWRNSWALLRKCDGGLKCTITHLKHEVTCESCKRTRAFRGLDSSINIRTVVQALSLMKEGEMLRVVEGGDEYFSTASEMLEKFYKFPTGPHSQRRVNLPKNYSIYTVPTKNIVIESVEGVHIEYTYVGKKEK